MLANYIFRENWKRHFGMFSNKIRIFGSVTVRPTDEDQTVRKRCGLRYCGNFKFFLIRFLAQFREGLQISLSHKQNLKFLFCLCLITQKI